MLLKKMQRQTQADPAGAEHLRIQHTWLSRETHDRWVVTWAQHVGTPVGTPNHKGLNELHFLTPSCHNLQLSCAPLWCFYFMRFFTQLLPLKFLGNVR